MTAVRVALRAEDPEVEVNAQVSTPRPPRPPAPPDPRVVLLQDVETLQAVAACTELSTITCSELRDVFAAACGADLTTAFLDKSRFNSLCAQIVANDLDEQNMGFLSFAMTNIFNAYLHGTAERISAVEVRPVFQR